MLNTTAAASTTSTPATKRFYVRCEHCLATSVIEAAHARLPIGAVCGICKGTMRVLGVVTQKAAWVRVEERCPCDQRCTGASGPSCECQCGGKNHGSNLLVAVIVANGTVTITPAKDADKHRAWAAAYEAALVAAEARMAAHPAIQRAKRAKALGQWATPADYAVMRDSSALFRKALRMESHPARMKALAKVAASAPADQVAIELERLQAAHAPVGEA